MNESSLGLAVPWNPAQVVVLPSLCTRNSSVGQQLHLNTAGLLFPHMKEQARKRKAEHTARPAFTLRELWGPETKSATTWYLMPEIPDVIAKIDRDQLGDLGNMVQGSKRRHGNPVPRARLQGYVKIVGLWV